MNSPGTTTTPTAEECGSGYATPAAPTSSRRTPEAPEPARREPARITIGTDPSGMPRRPDPKRHGGAPQRPPSAGATAPAPDGRNLPVAVASGLVLAAVFLGLSMWRPAGALAFVTVALGLAAVEYFCRASPTRAIAP